MIPMWERSAMTHFVMGRYQKAEEMFLKIKEVQPDKFGLIHNLGLVSLAQDKFEEAEQCFLTELEKSGEIYMRVKALADTYYIWGKREKCLEFYERTLKLCQNELDKKLITRRLEQSKDEAVFAEAMKSQKELKRGNQFMAEKNFDSAYECFQRAAKIDPSNFQAFNNLGALEISHKKNTGKAVEFLEKAVAYTSLAGIHANYNHAKNVAAKEAKK